MALESAPYLKADLSAVEWQFRVSGFFGQKKMVLLACRETLDDHLFIQDFYRHPRFEA